MLLSIFYLTRNPPKLGNGIERKSLIFYQPGGMVRAMEIKLTEDVIK